MEQIAGTIAINNIELTTISYKTVSISNVSKNVSLKNSSKNNNTGNSSGNNSKQNQTTEVSSNSPNIDNTNSKKQIPQLGTNKIVILAISGIVLILIVTIRKLRKV